MSDQEQQVQENAGAEATHFTSVAQFVTHLNSLPHETLPKDWVVAQLEAIRPASTVAAPRSRGQLAGLDVNEMDLAQAKREKINAGSVLYKAVQRGASAETIAKNQARVDAVNARLAQLQPAAATPAAPTSETQATDTASAPVSDTGEPVTNVGETEATPASETSAEL